MVVERSVAEKRSISRLLPAGGRGLEPAREAAGRRRLSITGTLLIGGGLRHRPSACAPIINSPG
jgi:hypothetical protein